MCAYSLDHITPSRLGAIVFANSYNDYSIRIRQDPRLSLYDTLMRHRLKRSLLPMLSKNRTTARGRVRNLVCAVIPHPARTGGASRDRTDDPLLAKQVLSQLSYGPDN